MSIYYVANVPYSDELYHHGVRGQKWGIRRFQNPDGSLTEAGLKRYGNIENIQREQKNRKDKRRSTFSKLSNFGKQNIQNAANNIKKLFSEESSIKRGEMLKESGHTHGKNVANTLLNSVGNTALTFALSSTAALSGHDKVARIINVAGSANGIIGLGKMVQRSVDMHNYNSSIRMKR